MNKHKQGAMKLLKSLNDSINTLISTRTEDYLKDLGDIDYYNFLVYTIPIFTEEVHKSLGTIFNIYKDHILSLDKVKKDDEDELEKLKEEVIQELQKVYQDYLIIALETYWGDTTESWGFNVFDEDTLEYLKSKSIKWSKQVADTTEKRVKELLAQGFEEGLGSYDIADLLYEDYMFSYSRCESIARTEVLNSSRYIEFELFNNSGEYYAKKWSSIGGPRTRPAHAEASGQIKKMDEPFIVDGEQLMYPGDDSMGASAGNIIRCRCTVFYLTKEEYLALI